MSIDIDFVIPWVDGSDPDWQKEKKSFEGKVIDFENEIISEKRYRDWGLLKYWFRGIEKFAPWVRNVHFITWGHLPEFLNINHPKLKIVKHNDFLPKEILPIFNVCPIEVNLHKVPNLAEHFVYFNDDTFLLQPVKKSDFFIDGIPTDEFYESPSCLFDFGFYGRILYNDVNVINKNFNKYSVVKKNWKKWLSCKDYNRWKYTLRCLTMNEFVGFSHPHLPNAFLKQTWVKVWSKESSLLELTMNSKFLCSEMVNQDVFRYWQFAEGCFSPRKPLGTVFQIKDEALPAIVTCIKKSCYKELCLNDFNGINYENCKRQIIDAFEQILPEKSTFEK